MNNITRSIKIVVGTIAGLAVIAGSILAWRCWGIQGWSALLGALVGSCIISAALDGDCDCGDCDDDEEEI